MLIFVLARDRILLKYGYVPDKQEQVTDTGIKKAKPLCLDWAA